MRLMMKSHGKIEDAVPVRLAEAIKTIARSKAKIHGTHVEYLKDLDLESETINKLGLGPLRDIAEGILGTRQCELKTVEYHNRRSHGEEIPPHQDNFYHCIKGGRGLKLLVPLVKLNSTNGGLVFANTEWDYPTQPHHPAYNKDFSAMIRVEDIGRLKNDAISYECEVGDITYHSLSSVHWASSNTTDEDADFIVFRFQDRDEQIDMKMVERYQFCYAENLASLRDRTQT